MNRSRKKVNYRKFEIGINFKICYFGIIQVDISNILSKLKLQKLIQINLVGHQSRDKAPIESTIKHLKIIKGLIEKK